MNQQKIGLLITLSFALILAIGCQQNDSEPPPLPTNIAPTATTVIEPTVEPTLAPLATAEPTAEPEAINPNPKTILISHILAGVPGNNNYDYIALYNNSGGEVDLNGYALTYQPRPGDEPETLIEWSESTPFVQGFYVMGRLGESFDQPLDTTFDKQIFNRGSLVLSDSSGQIVDLVGWGNMPAGSLSGAPAPKLPRGATLVRQLEPPFAIDSTSNADLFFVVESSDIPNCADSGSPVAISVDPIVNPGAEFAVTVQISAPHAIDDVSILIPAGFSLASSEPFMEPTYVTLEAPLTNSYTLNLIAPVTLQSVTLRGSRVIVGGQSICVPITTFAVEGVLPIALARTFIDQTVTVEGIATMYTDGFFAGSSGTKFYIEDETGGVQIFVPGGKGGVRIAIGDLVRVTGKTELYRTSLEVIPNDYDSQIEIIEKAADSGHKAPLPTDILSALNDEALVGQLVVIEGIIGRLQEFNYSHEVDLTDSEGNKILVYIDKLTELSLSSFDVGQEIAISGIIESWDGRLRLNPRLQSDLARIWPEELRVEVHAPAAVAVSPVDYQIKVTNHTSQSQTNLLVTAPRPEGAIETIIVDGGVTATREIINWLVPELAPSQTVTMNMEINLMSASNASEGPADRVFFFPVTVVSDQSEPLKSADLTVYTGGILPIWAIQGSGEKSFYVGRTATTSGIITAIYPELDGFFIQSQTDDQNVSTSNGLFVHLIDSDLPDNIGEGMLINVTGNISEQGGQTEIQLDSGDESHTITIISTTNLLKTIDLSPLTPPEDRNALDYFEAREGMLVSLDGYAVAVGPTNRFGEIPVYPLSLVENLESNAPLIFRNPDSTMSDAIIYIDDGSGGSYENGDSLPLAISTGDIISSVSGPLAFTFGNYKIEPQNMADIIVEPSTYAERAVVEPEPRSEHEVAIATFNVENFFDPFDPHPSSPPLPSLDEYRQKLAKLSAAYELMGYPEIVALQEAENLKVLEDLAEQIAADGGPSYQAHLLEGSDGRGIDVAYMTRQDRVTLISLEQRPAPEGVTSREPLLISVQVQVGNNDQTIVLINNHFTSLASGEEASLPRRLAQAEWNAGIVEELLDFDPNTHIVMLGDLNSFRYTPPLDTLESHLNHIYGKEGMAKMPYPPYTYIFQGVAQSLDHILVSDTLFEALTDVVALPINADYPLPATGDVSPYRASDHNPLIAIFDFE